MSTVLHVTESMGGGTASAMLEFVRSTAARHEHHLIYLPRPGSELDTRYDDVFETTTRALGKWTGLTAAVRSATAARAFDVVHVHSSWAGLAVRRHRATTNGVPILYSPHCFFFERDDLLVPVRRLARGVERYLGRRTALAVCVSPREAELARSLGLAAEVVPNVSSLVGSGAGPAAGGGGAGPATVIVSVGRLSRQKDPHFFAAAARQFRLREPNAEFVWVGDGDRELRTGLAGADVLVTGWLGRDGLIKVLERATAYLHTARWEASPMSILEAVRLGVPVVARSSPSLVSLGLDPTLVSVEAVVDELWHVRTTGDVREPARYSRFRDFHTAAHQAERLDSIYSRFSTVRAVRPTSASSRWPNER